MRVVVATGEIPNLAMRVRFLPSVPNKLRRESVEQGHIPVAEIPLWIALIKMIGYVLGASIPAYFTYRIVVKRMPFRKREDNGDSN